MTPINEETTPAALVGDGLGHAPEPHQRLLDDTDVDIINRAQGEVQPFSQIKKRPSTTSTGNVTGYGVEIRDPSAENGWRVCGQVGPNYLLVDNREVVEVAEEIVRASPFAQQPRKVFFDGKRLIYSTVLPQESVEGPRGDELTVGLQFRNSYNGSMRFRASLYVERLICNNGMTSTEHFASHTFRHTVGNEGWQGEVEEAMGVLRSAPDRLEHFANDLCLLDDTSIELQDVLALRRQAEGFGALPVSRFGEVMDALTNELVAGNGSGQPREESPATAYNVLNGATQVLWHRNRSVKDLEYNEGVVGQLLDYSREHRN